MSLETLQNSRAQIWFVLDEGNNYSGAYNVPEIDLPEKLCAEHIAGLVNLNYHLASTNTRGIATLRGISLSSTMLDLVTVSPIQWGNYHVPIYDSDENINLLSL